MEKIIKERNSGKTTELIKISAQTKNYIICHDHREANRIQDMAHKMGLNIPLPITYREFVGKSYYAKGIKGFLIDNIEMFCQSLTTVPINAITLNPD
jgi:hypothetical protein